MRQQLSLSLPLPKQSSHMHRVSQSPALALCALISQKLSFSQSAPSLDLCWVFFLSLGCKGEHG